MTQNNHCTLLIDINKHNNIKCSIIDSENKEQQKPEEVDPNQITLGEFVDDDSILEKETVHELMKEAVASEQKTTKKKSFITNLIFLAINIVLMVFIVKNLLESANGSNPLDVFVEQGPRMWWLLRTIA